MMGLQLPGSLHPPPSRFNPTERLGLGEGQGHLHSVGRGWPCGMEESQSGGCRVLGVCASDVPLLGKTVGASGGYLAGRTLIRSEKLIPAGGAARRPSEGSEEELVRVRGNERRGRLGPHPPLWGERDLGRLQLRAQQEGGPWVWRSLRLVD